MDTFEYHIGKGVLHHRNELTYDTLIIAFLVVDEQYLNITISQLNTTIQILLLLV